MRITPKKRETRRSRSQQAWIRLTGGFASRQCTLMDISQNGAKLVVSDPSDIPSSFTLSTQPGETAGRPCQVIWRRGKMVGVRFGVS